MRWIAAPLALVLLVGCSSVAGVATPGPMPPPMDASDDTGDDGGWLSTTFDREAVERDVRAILTDQPAEGFGLTDVGDVTCPADMEVEAGVTHTCDVEIGGEDKEVDVHVMTDDGTYEVGYPS